MERPVQAPRQLPPGFRFHPTDEELVVQYLRRKALSCPLPAAVIPVVHDVARRDPWDLPGASDGEGYFFNQRRAPATGGGRRRRAGSGYWKATGKEKPVFLQCGGGVGGGVKRQLLVGVKTALTFHHGKPSRASPRTGWVMHEYRLAVPEQTKNNASHDRVVQLGEWVVCRIFLKNKSGRPNRDADGQTPGNRPSVFHRTELHRRREDAAGQQRPLLSSSPQPSFSSCVTGVTDTSDQEEVSSSSNRDAPAASPQ
ncbi:NAC domain-containing protein 83-like [Phragmites australis]|uniref:NAC domain-containing protein 83-like n=1 Tax=Phragmites australis TaxID=29695 RepID=UPI002D77B656|nr:NAC domain-containing protein 83-like [Phragmites australis]